MPFCSQCGNQVGAVDAFCGRCGGRQPSTPPPSPLGTEVFSTINPRTAAILCYVPGIGWIASILVLASEQFRRNRKIRFHAFQGLYLFVAWLMEDWVLKPMLSPMAPVLHVHQILQTALLVMAIFMMVKASHDEAYPLPVFGELAQRSIMED
jgi:uncharacterized membrane protein